MSRIQDKPSPSAHPGWRVLYNFVTWVILGIALMQGENIFIGLFMLGCGLVFDYIKTNPIIPVRIWVRRTGIFVAFMIVTTNLIATFGAFSIDFSNSSNPVFLIDYFPFFQGTTFSAKWYWLANGIAFVTTLVDWVVEYVPEPKSNRAKLVTTASVSEPQSTTGG